MIDYIVWDVPGDVLTAPESALRGWNMYISSLAMVRLARVCCGRPLSNAADNPMAFI